MELRPYQREVLDEIYSAWSAGATNVCVQLATGAGKTVLFSTIMNDYPGIGIAIAHRVELVSQISLTLARHGVRHNIIAQKGAIREIVALHMAELGRNWFDPGARRHVAGVDTLIRMDPGTPWFTQVGLVVQDEGHHPLRDNKWGHAASLFPNARGLYPTATPVRADGRGLGRHADGLMDRLITGISMRELIIMGYLTDYRIFAPPNTLDLSLVPVTATGDFSAPRLRTEVHRASITGDVVAHYLRIAPGKLGVTFAVDVDAATEIADAFRRAGVSSEVISSKTPDLLRSNIMRQFRNRQILQLVNVDLLGEGVDVPAIEVVSMARPTQSYGLYSQQFGRALRPMEGKTHAIIIDHVGNTIRHGLPDAPKIWTLDRRERNARRVPDDVIPLRVCSNDRCLAVYPRNKAECPVCGYRPQPAGRSTPEQVDGDLLELDEETLARLRGEVDRVDGAPRIPRHLDPIAQRAIGNRHRHRQQMQTVLRASIAQWAGFCKAQDMQDSEIFRIFYLRFGIDILSAQALNTNEADELDDRINFAIDEIRSIG